METLVRLLIKLFKLLFGSKEKKTYKRTKYYSKKFIMTKTEEKFYNMFIDIVGNDYLVWPQINLATIIKKNGDFKYQNELYRNIDFGIFSKDKHELLLLIEINDETHNNSHRRKRDITVDQICSEAGYKLVKFWTNKPNDFNYVKQRILSLLPTIDLDYQVISLLGSEIDPNLANKMFDIISTNMKELFPNVIVDNDTYNRWHDNCIKNDKNKTILYLNKYEIGGYLQYSIKDDYILLSEVEIKKEHQGNKKTFRALMKKFIDNINKDSKVRLKINSNNKKSIDVFKHIRFIEISNGQYEITGDKLISWLNKK